MPDISTTRWSPDTCECILDVTHDYSSGQPVETERVFVSQCQFHLVHLPTDILKENQIKNQAIAALVAAAPNLPVTKQANLEKGMLTPNAQVDTPDVSTLQPQDVKFSYDENRNLILDTGFGLDPDAAAQALKDAVLPDEHADLSLDTVTVAG